MPQEGLNVFYRFFRDRISWFEADAVCQFHHASLVTVDNSFQFDATRDLLRELDINDIVWIGLIRPQSSERFMWSNSRPLIANTGYWAESLPLMEAPLCAVIDPIRDYRWHALRCGGPETASFLCEMAVPTWAEACLLKDIPNLIMQYMADTANVELIRTCHEEGTLRQTCKGKEDRARIIRELVCPRERMEAQRINDITNSHFKSLKIINSVRTDNNENNDIELVPINVVNYETNVDLPDASTEKNTVQRLIEQFNVDELMQADEPTPGLSDFNIPGVIPKPVKKMAKKYSAKQPTKPEALAMEDMMLGDQPQGEPEMLEHVLEDEVSNEVIEALPHSKKIMAQDLKILPSIVGKEKELPIVPAIHHESIAEHTPGMGHPVHPQSAHEESPRDTHNKEPLVDNSHFIPPMLLVKSHYAPPGKHQHEHEHEQEREQKHENEKNSQFSKPQTHQEHHVHLHNFPKVTTTITTPATVTNTPLSTETSSTLNFVGEKISHTKTMPNEISVSTTQLPVTTSAVSIPSNRLSTIIGKKSVTEASNIKRERMDMHTPVIERAEMTKPTDLPTANSFLTTTITSGTAIKIPIIDDIEIKQSNEKAVVTNSPEFKTTIITIKTKPTFEESIKSTDLGELHRSTIKKINNKRQLEKTATSTVTPATTIIADAKESLVERWKLLDAEEERYERMFASKTTPNKAREFEARVAAALAAASKLGQHPTLPYLPQITETTVTAAVKQQNQQYEQQLSDTKKEDKADAEKVERELEQRQTEQATIVVTTIIPFVQQALSNKPMEVQAVKTIDQNSNIDKLHATETNPATTTTTSTTSRIPGTPTRDIKTKRQNFMWYDTTTTYKPNRRRLLTKPETLSFFKKVVG